MRACLFALLLAGAVPAQAQEEAPPAPENTAPPAADAPSMDAPAAQAPTSGEAPSSPEPPAVEEAPTEASPGPRHPSREGPPPAQAPAPAPQPEVQPAAGATRAVAAPAIATQPLAPPAAPAPASPPSAPGEEREEVARQARQLFAHVVAGDARGISRMAAYPFQLEGQRLTGEEDLFQEWLRQLRGKRTDLLHLEAVEVLTPAEMEQRHGPPPARLAALPWKAPRTYIAVATLSGRAAVAIFREEGATWRLVAFHD